MNKVKIFEYYKLCLNELDIKYINAKKKTLFTIFYKFLFFMKIQGVYSFYFRINIY